MKFQAVTILFLVSINLFSQDYIGYFKKTEEIESLVYSTRISFNLDSTFKYYFVGDLFYDEAIGTYVVRNDTIYLKFETPNHHYAVTTDTIIYTWNIKPPTTYYYIHKDYLKIKIPGAELRPEILIFHGNKLFNINIKGKIVRKYHYYRVSQEDWNDNGASFIRYINSTQNN